MPFLQNGIRLNIYSYLQNWDKVGYAFFEKLVSGVGMFLVLDGLCVWPKSGQLTLGFWPYTAYIFFVPKV